MLVYPPLSSQESNVVNFVGFIWIDIKPQVFSVKFCKFSVSNCADEPECLQDKTRLIYRDSHRILHYVSI